MATLDKLCIQGVRAFSPHNPSTIEFFRPLTLIVGPNGSGKTTIIECLKFATTGELPPYARSGQAFVHDPKISNEVEVKASVKLKFTSITGKAMLIAKNCQVRQKLASKLEFKMLDASLVVRDAAGVKQSHGYKCADLDKETPLLLGVPKPILENVIFCHQEDSGWPLADAAQLKSRFDSIFATTRYSKALASLREQVRDLRATLRGLKGELSGCEMRHEYVQKLQSEVAASKARIDAACKAIAEVDGEILDLEKRVAEATQQAKTDEMTAALYNRKEAQLREMAQTNDELYHDLSRLYTDSDNALRKFKAEFATRMAGLRQQHEALDAELRKRESEIRKMEGSIGEQAETVTRYRGRIESFTADCRRRDDKLCEVLRLAGLPEVRAGAQEISAASPMPLQQSSSTGGGDLLSEGCVLEATERLQIEADKRQAELTQLQARSEAAAAKHSEELNELTVKCSTLARQVEERVSEQRKLEAEAMRWSKEAAGSGVVGGGGAVGGGPGSAHYSIPEIEAELKAAELSLSERAAGGSSTATTTTQASLKAEIERKERARAVNEASVGELSEVWKRLHDAAQRLSAIEQKRIRVNSARERCNAVISERCVEFEAVFGPDFRACSHMSLQGWLDKVIQKRREVHAALIDEQRRLSREQGAAQSRRRAKEEELSREKGECDRLREKFGRMCSAQSLDDILRSATRKLKKVQQNHLEAKSGSFLYDGFVESAQTQMECPLCERAFDETGVRTFTERVRGRLASVPELLAATEKKFTEASAYVEQLTALMPEWKRFQALSESSAQGVAELSGAEQECSRLEAQNVDLQGRLGDAKSAVDAALALQSDVAQVRSLAVEIELLEVELAEESLEEEVVGPPVGHEKASKLDSESVANQLNALRAENERISRELRAMRNNLEDWRKAEDRVHALRERLSRARVAERAEREQDAAERAVRSGAEQLERLRHSQPPLEAQRAAKQRVVEHLRVAANHELQAAHASAGKFATALSSLCSWNAELARRVQEQVAERAGLARAERRSEEHKAKLSELREGVRDLRVRINEKSQMLASEEATERTIADNLRWRERKVAIAGLKVEIAELRAVLEARESEQQRVAALSARLSAARARRAEAVGQQTAYGEDLAEKEQVMQRPEYRSAGQKCFDKQVEVKETECGIGDLERYIAALDRSLSTFHNQKMQEINQIIREYWQATYRGQDIDTVEIRADVEKANKSFSYRVAMIKGETVLDMRGRCSSGQKVLACLIIRLALAETFGVNCGILTLDEPTTNLDHANVSSFASSLINIVTRRARQASFQLVVITHDEEFLEALGGQRQFCDYYYRVSKDDVQCSQIERQRF